MPRHSSCTDLNTLMALTIYHNPRCSKSRQTLELLTSKGCKPKIVEYLNSPPNVSELANIIDALRAEPIDVMRTNESEFKAARAEVEAMNRNGQIEWLAENIRVLQRPIVIDGAQARVGRPPESVLEIID